MMMAQPDVIKLTPATSPSAQLAVFGQPSLISPARVRSAMPLASDDSARRIYFNVDKDWHRYFTVPIERKDNEMLRAAGIDTKALAGKRLPVRGWIEWRNSTMIHATHLEQIEILPDARGATPQPPETQPPQSHISSKMLRPGASRA